MKKVILSGFTPTGRLHFGHYIGCLKDLLAIQEETTCYFLIADLHAGTTQHVMEMVKDLLAMDFKGHVYLQSDFIFSQKLTLLLVNVTHVGRLNRIPVLKEEIKMKKEVRLGYHIYPVGQTADVLALYPDEVMIGRDQKSIMEFAEELRNRFNTALKEMVFKPFSYRIGGSLAGIKGGKKMSKSQDNAIYLTEPVEEIRKKIQKIPTSSEKTVEDNLVFSYLDFFHPDANQMKQQYLTEQWGDKENKEALAKVMCELSRPWREKRAKITDQEVMDALNKGREAVNERAKELDEKLCYNHYLSRI